MRKLSKQDCISLMERGEFDAELRGAAPAVAFVLTQSWCSQWAWMRSYLEGLPLDSSREVFWVEYDLEDFYDAFLRFKEEALGNDQVPYVRFYRDGVFSSESNFLDEGAFKRRLSGGA